MKKIIKVVSPLLAVSILSAGCSYHSSDPSKKEEMIGTYELVEYKKKNSEGELYDYQSEINAKAYFTLDEDGYGYYAYQDNSSPLKVTQVYSFFEKDDEEEGKYKSITLRDGETDVSAWEWKVGCLDEPTMGFQKNLFKKTFSYTIPAHTYNIYNPPKQQEYQYVCYKKISTETSLDTIREKTGFSGSFNKPFEMKLMTGFFAYTHQTVDGVSYSDENTDYMILDMESFNDGKLTLYYSEKGTNSKKTMEIPVEIEKNDSSFNNLKLTVFDKIFKTYSNNSMLSTYLPMDVLNTTNLDYYSAQFSHYYGQGTTIDEIIANLGK